jgi:hypothetical protein
LAALALATAQPQSTGGAGYLIAAYAGQAGMAVSEETLLTILGVGVALILGIAHEDAGRAKSSSDRS